jgi:hypothetical protein
MVNRRRQMPVSARTVLSLRPKELEGQEQYECSNGGKRIDQQSTFANAFDALRR